MSLPLPTLATAVLSAPPMTFPATVRRVVDMVGDPACSPHLLADVLATDPIIAALVLSRANAAAAPGQPPLTQLSSAVVYLGLSMVHGLLTELLPTPAAQRRELAAHWAAANACGTMTEILASQCLKDEKHRPSGETLHLCGLLHDLGAILACIRFPHQYHDAGEAVRARDDLDFSGALRKQLGLHPGGLGALLAKNWCLPEPITACIRHHARPDRAGDQLPVVCLIHVARVLVRGCGFTTAAAPFVEPLADTALDRLGLRIADLERAVGTFFDQIEELEMYEGVLAG